MQGVSVTEALKTGLLRTADSNDYPAWAMGIVQLAAARMHDENYLPSYSNLCRNQSKMLEIPISSRSNIGYSES